MFEIGVVQTKAGHVGQIKAYSDIVWESEPFPAKKVLRENDRLERYSDLGAEEAIKAADTKLKSVLAGLFG
jgi:hypothetical protein